jgi:predicted kinase
MNKIFLVRGVPGSGKSQFAKSIFADVYLETDMYFMKDGEYKFDISKLKEAHLWCQRSTEHNMQEGNHIVVSNTFTQEWEMKPYLDLAEQYGYQVTTVIVENRHGSKDIHGVPEETLQKMKDRFEVVL